MLFLSIIVAIGVLTTFTDLKNKKIYNRHLVIGTVIGVIAIVYTAVFRHESVLFQITNGLVAFPIGLLMHRAALWKGGDAKLFTLYAFLMPPPAAFNHIPFPSAISLFACSFIAGMLILFPVFIKDMIINHNAIINDLFLPTKLQALFHGIGRAIFYSWALFPLYYLLKLVKIPFLPYCFEKITSPVIVLTIMFLIFSGGYKIKKEAEKHFLIKFFKKNSIELAIGIIFGFLMRLWLAPDSLSYPALKRYFVIITLSSAISTCIHIIYNHFKNYQERFPFAPLLFIGCILSYSSFLPTLTHTMTRWNALRYH